MPRTSAPVKTAWMPGTCCAREVSIRRMRAWGKGLRRARPHRVPGSATSAVYCVMPVTLSGPSTLAVGLPMVVYIILFPSPIIDGHKLHVRTCHHACDASGTATRTGVTSLGLSSLARGSCPQVRESVPVAQGLLLDGLPHRAPLL